MTSGVLLVDGRPMDDRKDLPNLAVHGHGCESVMRFLMVSFHEATCHGLPGVYYSEMNGLNFRCGARL